jgi:NADH-quinone oxidoreductase subunit G
MAAIEGSEAVMGALREPGAVLMVGERAATTPGLLSGLAGLADATGARLAWVPRRAGERGALDAGLLPAEGGVGFAGVIERLVDAAAAGADDGAEIVPVVEVDAEDADAADDAAAVDVVPVTGAEAGDTEEEPEPPYRALIVAGFDPEDVPGGYALVEGFAQVPCVVALATHHNAATRAADVVFPVATVTEKAGSFTNWEGRRRSFPKVLRESLMLADAAVLAAIADEMLVDFDADPQTLRAEIDSSQRPEPAPLSRVEAQPAPLGVGEAVLATWRQLIDDGAMQAGEPYLSATARPAVVRVSPSNAADLGIADGDPVTVTGEIGSVTLPALVTDMPSGVVWIPMNSGTNVVSALGVASGDTVRVSVGRVS